MKLKQKPLNKVHKKLIKRYIGMLDTIFLREEKHIMIMLYELKKNLKTFPPDKTSRWIGYIQRFLIEQNFTTVKKERDFSRPLFHKAYKKMGYKIPKTKDLK